MQSNPSFYYYDHGIVIRFDPDEGIPELVCAYRLEALDSEGNWITLASEANNRRRKRVHRLEEPVQSATLRLVVESTNGSDYAEVIEVRGYS
ncbi:hypothetical protein AB4124_08710 [Paenibacillus sp. 2KB_20]|uniref:hypothetical protein n=1 Tax=Paenibacillus sp. 2KB_20 TaxID=3232977 RepID=UPI003F9B4BE9